MALSLEFATDVPSSLNKDDLHMALDLVQVAADAGLNGKISLVFTDEPTARQLNLQYAGNDYATDVLSFNYFEGEDDEPGPDDTLGEVVVCVPVAQKQAEEHGQDMRSELLLLVVHGMMHVLGYDHAGQAEQTSFAHAQSAILSKLKVDARGIFNGNTR